MVNHKCPFSTNEIIYLRNEPLYSLISSLALQFAILDYTSVSSRLVSKLNIHDAYHNQGLKLRSLWILWDLLGEWPDGEEKLVRGSIEETRKSASAVEDQKEEGRPKKQVKLSSEHVDIPITRSDIKMEVARVAKRYAEGWFWPTDPSNTWKELKDGPHSHPLSQKAKLSAIKHLFTAVESMNSSYSNSSSGGGAMSASSALASALDLQIAYIDADTEDSSWPESVPAINNIMGIIGGRLNANCQIDYLAQSKHAWTILKDSENRLAKVIGLDEHKASDFAKEVEDAIDERLKNGRLLPPEMPLRKILETMEHNTKTNPDALEGGSQLAGTDLFRPPATPAQIAEAEKRLDIALPSDYKAFLTITNGFGPAFSGILFEPPLHAVEDIRWFTPDEDYFIELPLEMPGGVMFSMLGYLDFDGDGAPEKSWPQVGRAIEIGTEDIDNIWLIPPSKVAQVQGKIRYIMGDGEGKEGGHHAYPTEVQNSTRRAVESFAGSLEKFYELEWCCVTWTAGGSAVMEAHPSFTAYLRSVMEEGKVAEGRASRGGAYWKKFFGYAFSEVQAVSE